MPVGAETKTSPESSGAASEPSSSSSAHTSEGKHEVHIQVYDFPSTVMVFDASSILKDWNVGIFHCGVEVCGKEWSFQGFEDTWENDNISGVVCHLPKQNPDYKHRETVYMGRTPLSASKVEQLLGELSFAWPANSYHLSDRNCSHFAEELLLRLRVATPIPDWVRGATDFTRENPGLNAVVDYGWAWAKSFMIWRFKEVARTEDQPITIGWAREPAVERTEL